MVKFGFLKPIITETEDGEVVHYEVRRIIKSRITSDKLEEFKVKLQQHA